MLAVLGVLNGAALWSLHRRLSSVEHDVAVVAMGKPAKPRKPRTPTVAPPTVLAE